ncbi:MAG TPA: hypothetical protein DCW35_05240 [Polynucleobacter sp.]|nr:hypothetical protein [Polynucleobacter sp.]
MVPVGYMNEGRWKHAVEIHQEAGALPSTFDLTGFLYEFNPLKDLKWACNGLTISTAILFISLAFLYYNVRLNRRLKYSLERVNHLSQHDSLTDLPNRILFADRLQSDYFESKTRQETISIALHRYRSLKSINDGYGHQEGNEFVVLLEGFPNASGALEVAKKIQASVSTPISHGGA